MPDFADSTSTELERKVAALRVVALVETVSYTALLWFWLSGNRIGTMLTGSVHGMIFLGFAAMVLGVRAPMRWTWSYAATAIILGPVGSLVVYARLRREGVPATSGSG